MTRYPDAFDDDTNLFLVHDSLRLTLATDYNPGDTSITIEGDSEIFARFPPVGLLTLTEQCSDIDLRALSFFYTGKGTNTFTGLELIPCFTDSYKPKRLTHVLQNVMAQHHNAIKDALIAIQKFAGFQGEISKTALKGTMEARINFLRKLVLRPTAWFSANLRIGVIPLCVNFQDFSTRFPDEWDWDFGDSTGASIIRTDSILSGNISKCYYMPGIYPVRLKVKNPFGENEITITDYITARVEAPNLATIEMIPSVDQNLSGGVLRTRVDRTIQIQVTNEGSQPLDPVVKIIWNLQDDLQHDTSFQTVAQYGVGGFYDIKTRAETQLGAYRVTDLINVIDVVERTNIWHFIFDSLATSVTKTASVYEFGLVSETYKTAMPSTLVVTRDYRFLTGKLSESQQKREFSRNNGFAPRSLVSSGDGSYALAYWSEGAEFDYSSQVVRFKEFNGFNQLFSTPSIDGGGDYISRYWNWLSLVSTNQVHFLLGLSGPYPQPANSPTNMDMDTLFLGNLAIESTTFIPSDFVDCTELQNNVTNGLDGDFSVYRGIWRDSNGYFVRNDGTGSFYRLKSFYRTETTIIGLEVDTIRKLPNMPGTTKLEGQLVSLSQGLYFFNNTGEVVAYDPVANLWATGGPGVNSPVFSALQDITTPGYDNPANTLVAVSDGDRRAYLFYDYSANANLSFNEIDKTFRRLPPRPLGEQFLVGLY